MKHCALSMAGTIHATLLLHSSGVGLYFCAALPIVQLGASSSATAGFFPAAGNKNGSNDNQGTSKDATPSTSADLLFDTVQSGRKVCVPKCPKFYSEDGGETWTCDEGDDLAADAPTQTTENDRAWYNCNLATQKGDCAASGCEEVEGPPYGFLYSRGTQTKSGSTCGENTCAYYEKEKSPLPISKRKSVMLDLRTQIRYVLQEGIAARSPG